MGDIVDELDLQSDIERAQDVAQIVGAYWKQLRRVTGAQDKFVMPMAVQFQIILLTGVTEYVMGGSEMDGEGEDEYSG